MKKVIFLPLLLALVACNNSTTSSEKPISSGYSSSSYTSNSSISNTSTSSSSSSSSESKPSSSEETNVTSVRFIKKTINIKPNESFQLTWRIAPTTAINQNVSFTIENESIATINDKGLVLGKSLGTTIVTIISEDGHLTDTATINVIGEEVFSLKINVPEKTLKDDTGNYLLKVGDTLQLSYTKTPTDAYNQLKFTSTSTDGDASSYLKVDQNGLLTALNPKSKITITLSADNLVEDSVTFSVVKDQIYARYLLNDLTKNSKSLEGKNIVSGTKKITHKRPKSYIDSYTDESFKIYSNGVERTYTEYDYDLSKETQYQGFYGIHNNKFYQILRDETGKYKDTSVKEINKDITLEKATEQSSLALHKTYYSFHDIVLEEYFTGTNYFNYTGEWKTFRLDNSSTIFKIEASYEKPSTSWIVPATYRELSLTINLNEAGMITAFTFECSDYDTSGYDFSKHELKTNATAIEYWKNEFLQLAGTRETASSLSVNPEECYFTSFDLDLYYISRDEVTTTFDVGDTINFTVKEGLPNTATTMIDNIKFLSSSNIEVVNITGGGLKALSPGKTTLTFISSNNVTKEIDITVKYKDVSQIQINMTANGLKIGETIDNISVLVSPNGCDNRHSLTVIEGNELIELSHNDENNTYSVTAKALGKVILEATSLANDNIKTQKTIYVYNEITENEVQQTLIKTKFHTTISNGNGYTLSFLENGKGSVTELIDGIENVYGSFDYTISGFSIIISNVKSTNTSYFYSLGPTLTLSNNGIEIKGLLKYSQYGSTNCTFVKYE